MKTRVERLAQLHAHLWAMRSSLAREAGRRKVSENREIRANIRALFPKSCPDIQSYFRDILTSL